MPSPFPPFSGLSYTARARKPFGSLEGGCSVTLPKSSAPLSILPFPFLSRARKAFVEPGAVQLTGDRTPGVQTLVLHAPCVVCKVKP